jgi:hypothetical protein
MTMRRIIAAILALTLAATATTGCHTAKTNPAPTIEPHGG